LLTAAAAALASARRIGAGRAVLLIHEFRTPLTDGAKQAGNQRDLERFVRRVAGGARVEVKEGRLCGPFAVPGGPLFEDPPRLYVGKAVRELGGG
jgi:hypothetical protein